MRLSQVFSDPLVEVFVLPLMTFGLGLGTKQLVRRSVTRGQMVRDAFGGTDLMVASFVAVAAALVATSRLAGHDLTLPTKVSLRFLGAAVGEATVLIVLVALGVGLMCWVRLHGWAGSRRRIVQGVVIPNLVAGLMLITAFFAAGR
jgi:hypothetical protein